MLRGWTIYDKELEGVSACFGSTSNQQADPGGSQHIFQNTPEEWRARADSPWGPFHLPTKNGGSQEEPWWLKNNGGPTAPQPSLHIWWTAMPIRYCIFTDAKPGRKDRFELTISMSPNTVKIHDRIDPSRKRPVSCPNTPCGLKWLWFP